MSKNGLYWVSAISGIVAIYLGFQSMKAEREIQRFKELEVLTAKQNSLLNEQIRDYEWHIKNKGSYEDGVRDTLIKAGGGSYADGFAAAKMIYEDKSYVDGYHNAIAQFGYQPPKKMDYPQELNAIPATTTKSDGGN